MASGLTRRRRLARGGDLYRLLMSGVDTIFNAFSFSLVVKMRKP